MSNFDEKEAKRRLENRDISKIGLKFFAGGLSATLVSMSLNSTDHVKTRLQIQQKASILSQNGLVPYKSFGEAFGRIFREEGIGILLGRGIFSSAIREMSYSSVRMGLYDVTKQLLNMGEGGDVGLMNKIIAGGISGAIGSYLANPFDLIRIRQQGVLPIVNAEGKIVQGPKPYRHTFDAVVQIYRTEGGIKGLYRGVSATVLRAAVVTGSQLSSYDHAKHILIHQTSYFDDSFKTHMVASTIAGLCTAIASNPVDVIKTRYMNDQKGYSGIMDCFLKTVRFEGFKALYKGFLPNYIRLGGHCMFTLPLYEQMRQLFGLTTL